MSIVKCGKFRGYQHQNAPKRFFSYILLFNGDRVPDFNSFLQIFHFYYKKKEKLSKIYARINELNPTK